MLIGTMPTRITWNMGFNLACLTMNMILMIGKTHSLLNTFPQFTMDTAYRMNFIEVIQSTHGYVSKTIRDQEVYLSDDPYLCAGFYLPPNKSYYVFLNEQGTKMSIVSGVPLHPKPSFTLKHDVQMLISKTVKKNSDTKCQNASASELMTCILANVEDKILGTELPCMPFQYKDVFTTLKSKFPPCKDDPIVSSEAILVIIGAD